MRYFFERNGPHVEYYYMFSGSSCLKVTRIHYSGGCHPDHYEVESDVLPYSIKEKIDRIISKDVSFEIDRPKFEVHYQKALEQFNSIANAT